MCIFAFELHKSLINAAKDALFILNKLVTKKQTTGLRLHLFILTELAHRGKKDDMLGRSIEKLTKSFSIVNFFTVRVLPLSWVIRPVGNAIQAKFEKDSNNVDSVEREPEIPLPSPPTSPSVLKLFVDVRIRKHATDNCMKTDARSPTITRIVAKKNSSSSCLSSLLKPLS